VLLLNRLLDSDAILNGGDDIEGDIDTVRVNHIASTTPKWRKFKLVWWVQILICLVDLDEILYGGDDVEDGMDSILLNPVASTVPKWRTFKF
jgi:hypothetical protein